MAASVGSSIPRWDGMAHATGATIYVDDIRLPDMLSVKVLTSPVHKGLIRHLDVSAAERVPGVAAVLTARDIPGVNIYGLIPDQPVLARDCIRYKGERIAAVVAVDEDTALEAIEKIGLDIEEQTPVFDPVDAMRPGAPLVRPEGNLWHFNSGPARILRVGDVDRAFGEADYCIEGTYTSRVNDHAPIEPQVSVAFLDIEGRLTIHTVSQAPHFHRDMLSAVFRMPAHRIRYLGGTIGGGFGSKNDIHCDHVAGLAALKTGRPVKYRLTRAEETLYTTKRGAWTFEIKDGVKRNGRLVARRVRAVHDTGAYAGMGPYVVEKVQLFCVGPYRIPNVSYDGYAVFTNKPMASSMRSFGLVNIGTVVETQMNRLAEALGMDPWEIRFVNAWREGDTGPTQWKVLAPGLIEAMKRAAELVGVHLPDHLVAMSSKESNVT